jgi:hypothetical protein
MSKAHRTTITVPAELKARMDAVDEEVNWSAVACAAFDQKLAEIIKRRGVKDMKDAITRLRASYEKLGSDRYQQGHEAGQEWAKSEAEADQLEGLLHNREALGNDWWQNFEPQVQSAWGPDEQVFFWVCPEDDGDRHAAEEFWDAITRGDRVLNCDPNYVRGFAEGAIKLWTEVKDQF